MAFRHKRRPDSEWLPEATILLNASSQIAATLTDTLFRGKPSAEELTPIELVATAAEANAVSEAKACIPELSKRLDELGDPTSGTLRDAHRELRRSVKYLRLTTEMAASYLKLAEDYRKGGARRLAAGGMGFSGSMTQTNLTKAREALSRTTELLRSGDPKSTSEPPHPMVVPLHMFYAILSSMGWPRSGGHVRREKIVNASLVDSGVTLLFQQAIALGVDRPARAAQVLAHCFVRDWDARPPTELDAMLERHLDLPSIAENTAEFPWNKIWTPFRVGPRGTLLDESSVSWAIVTSQDFQAKLIAAFAFALIFSLRRSADARAALEYCLERDEERRPVWERAQAAGLDVNVSRIPTTIREIADTLDQGILEYESVTLRLEPLPRPIAIWSGCADI